MAAAGGGGVLCPPPTSVLEWTNSKVTTGCHVTSAFLSVVQMQLEEKVLMICCYLRSFLIFTTLCESVEVSVLYKCFVHKRAKSYEQSNR